MSFDKNYPNRKDWRKSYRRSKRFDRSCRCNGRCSYCRDNRMHSTILRLKKSEQDLLDNKGEN